jgi:hypothetical protein
MRCVLPVLESLTYGRCVLRIVSVCNDSTSDMRNPVTKLHSMASRLAGHHCRKYHPHDIITHPLTTRHISPLTQSRYCTLTLSVTVICNVSQRQVVVNRLELGGGWGSAPDWRQAGSRALGQQLLGCQRGSGRRSGQPPSYYLLAIRAALARPYVAADTRASGRTLRACCPLGAPLGGCSTSRRAAPCPRCSRGTLPQGTPACGSRTARPARHPA